MANAKILWKKLTFQDVFSYSIDMNVKKIVDANWCVAIPCKNIRVKLLESQSSKHPNLSNHKTVGNKFGRLFYRKTKGPIFDSPYLIPKNTTTPLYLKAPIRVDLEVTSRCNLRCRHCYTDKSKIVDLSYLRIKDLVLELKTMGVVGVQLLGGEPSLHPKIGEIIGFLHNHSLKVECVSNGMPSLPTNCLKASNFIDVLYISIDGTEKTHDNMRGISGSFRSALSSIRKFSKKGVRVFVVCTLNNLNKNQYRDVYKIVKHHGAENLIIKYMLPIGSGKNNYGMVISSKEQEEIRQQIKDVARVEKLKILDQMYASLSDTGEFSFFGCPGGRFSIRISPTGDVFWCIYSQDVLGNFLKSNSKKYGMVRSYQIISMDQNLVNIR